MDGIIDNMMAYKGEAPWHNKGFSVAKGMSGAEMLKVAKLDWTVERRALAMRAGHDNADVITETLKNFRAIVRADTHQVFQIATNRYHPHQNAEIVEFFRQYCEAGNAELETVGGIGGGSRIWALAKLNADSTIGTQDKLTGYALLATSHDGSMATVAKATQIRVVCQNTLSAALSGNGAEFRVRHSKRWTNKVAAQARETLGMATEAIHETNALARDLAHVQIDGNGRLEFISRLLNGESVLDQIIADSEQSPLDAIISASTPAPKDEISRVGQAILQAIVNSPGSNMLGSRDTLWGAINGVTYYVDHVRGRSQDSRLASAWFGTGDKLKQNAVSVAVDMAGISRASA